MNKLRFRITDPSTIDNMLSSAVGVLGAQGLAQPIIHFGKDGKVIAIEIGDTTFDTLEWIYKYAIYENPARQTMSTTIKFTAKDDDFIEPQQFDLLYR